MRTRLRLSAILPFCLSAILLALSAIVSAQPRPLVAPQAQAIYDRLLPQIDRIRIFDHHAHPGFADDQEIDPAPVPEGGGLPMPLRPTNPAWAAAEKGLFGPAGKASFKAAHPGAKYYDAILDRLGIDVSLANRITMADYLDPARFKWVFYVDPVMYPFDNTGLAARNADEAAFMPNQTKLLKRFLDQSGARALPSSFADYLAFVTHVLEDYQRRGAVAAKFEAAYFRSFVFDDPPRETAAAVYDRYRSGGVPSAADYKTFQDFVFRYILTEAGRLKLPVHIHSAVGAGDYFTISAANVLNLEPVLRDPRYESTTFVLIHGGYPFDVVASFMTMRRNVWIDSSAVDSFLLFPDELKRVLRRWFETNPDKVTYGSDAFPLDQDVDAAELYWIAVHNARTASAAALAEMVAAGEITEPQALKIARGYLHDNAAQLYK